MQQSPKELSPISAPRFSMSFLLAELTLFASAFAAISVCVEDWYRDYFDPFPPAFAVLLLTAALGGLYIRTLAALHLGLLLLLEATAFAC